MRKEAARAPANIFATTYRKGAKGWSYTGFG
jgi:hypothetical protein